ncbi:MAG: hypothetical protein A2Z66_12865 [Chloroflexi bacterium RBG_13_66_10]|nr:MAG: hypothetical protein A2Z66_12865 [Chloroflexi bacterium RBG_13_66_10]
MAEAAAAEKTTGTFTIDGRTLTWESPQLRDIEHFEAVVGPIVDLRVVNSAKGRVHLALACFKKHHPDLTAGVIGSWPASAFARLWDEVIEAAIPLWERPKVPPALKKLAAAAGQESDETSEQGGPEASSETSASPSSSSPDGSPNEPAASE